MTRKQIEPCKDTLTGLRKRQGKKLDKEQMIKALEVFQGGFAPFDATITELGLAKVNPHEDVERFAATTCRFPQKNVELTGIRG